MILTEFYKGQGLGNQLAVYTTLRVIAEDNGYAFGIKTPRRFKGADFLHLDFGEKVTGKSKHRYVEKKIVHPGNGSDIRLYDPDVRTVADDTIIDGYLQGEAYIGHRKEEIREWLRIDPAHECYEYADENTCVINFRGGEYARHPEFFLRKKYWEDAIGHMLKINPRFRFIVITDDTFTAKHFFPDYGVFHFSIGKDYSIIKNAHYLIISNSSFAWFPAWLNVNVKYCIAPKYWGRHNISDGYWSLGTNITKDWHYLDRDGNLSDYDTCMREFVDYQARHPDLFSPDNVAYTPPKEPGTLATLKRITPLWIKNIIKSAVNEGKGVLNQLMRPIDLMKEKRREKTWLSKLEIAAYRKKIKIYDAFNFFNELETLDLRLNILNDHVDEFVLIESTLTHSGLPKELYYEKNKHRFEKFNRKIRHCVIDTPLKSFADARARLVDPATDEAERALVKAALESENIGPGETSFLRDFYEKEWVKKALAALSPSDNDFCYVSDLDEIWNPEALVDYSKDDIYKFKQNPYIYYLNNRSNEDWSGWTGTIGTKYKNIKNACLNDLRTDGKTNYTVIRDGGWHFSFQGGAMRIKQKIESYSHQEINTENTKKEIEKDILQNKDIRGRRFRFWKDESDLPGYLLANKEKYREFFRD